MIEISESVSVVYEAFGENPRDIPLIRREFHSMYEDDFVASSVAMVENINLRIHEN